jgi:predicted flavoprotein YhiN
LKADLTAEAIRNRVGEEQKKWIHREHLCRVLRLGPAASALLRQTDFTALGVPWEWIKRYPIRLEGPMPIDGAISTAGGVCFEHLTRELMVEKSPGLFFAGEMLDWEAPTGGYLLQGCFATAARAADGVIAWLGGEAVTG